ELDELARREVAAVALRTAAAARGAGEDRPDADLLDARFLDRGGLLLVDLLVGVDDRLARERVGDLLECDAADDALAERLDDLSRLHDRARVDAVHRPAVDLVDDDVLRDVHETAGQGARGRGLQRGVGQGPARAVRRDEVVVRRVSLTASRP